MPRGPVEKPSNSQQWAQEVPKMWGPLCRAWRVQGPLGKATRFPAHAAQRPSQQEVLPHSSQDEAQKSQGIAEDPLPTQDHGWQTESSHQAWGLSKVNCGPKSRTVPAFWGPCRKLSYQGRMPRAPEDRPVLTFANPLGACTNGREGPRAWHRQNHSHLRVHPEPEDSPQAHRPTPRYTPWTPGRPHTHPAKLCSTG